MLNLLNGQRPLGQAEMRGQRPAHEETTPGIASSATSRAAAPGSATINWATTIILGTAYTARVTRSGWTIGVGGEYAFTNVLSGFVEYNYYDFGTRQIAFTPQVAGLGPAFVDVSETKSVVRAGLNVRFGR
jgi:opacity protein-like surface antigen